MPLIDVGAKAPEFLLKDQDGRTHSLKQYAGRSVVLYFYPKDDTDGCTKEACQFRDALPEFGGVKAVVLGVSPDSEASHRAFAGKHGLGFPLLADEPAQGASGEKGVPAVCERYGVWQEKSMYGRAYMGVVRTTYLIGGDGRVLKRWDKVSVPGHAAEVLAALGGSAGGKAKAGTKAVGGKTARARTPAKTAAGGTKVAKPGVKSSVKSSAKPGAKAGAKRAARKTS
jgi:peroxiredoxin Q/BCP